MPYVYKVSYGLSTEKKKIYKQQFSIIPVKLY